jgi:hypothetical protein
MNATTGGRDFAVRREARYSAHNGRVNGPLVVDTLVEVNPDQAVSKGYTESRTFCDRAGPSSLERTPAIRIVDSGAHRPLCDLAVAPHWLPSKPALQKPQFVRDRIEGDARRFDAK